MIIECAKMLFVEKGYHDTTVSDVINKSRIARSTFYSHFTCKMDIFLILTNRYSAALNDAILNINISRAQKEQPLFEQIRGMCMKLVEAIDKNRELTLLLITAPLGHDNDFDKCVTDFFTKLLNSIKQLFLEGMEGRTIRTLNPDIISYVIMGSVKQVLLQWIIYKDIKNIYEILDELIEYNLFGISYGGENP